jgi:sugar O-acyltransferase (sialic acid O-acetyltransferase NeuD family)
MDTLAIYGSGGFAREVLWLVQSTTPQTINPVCFIDDHPQQQGKIVHHLPVLSFDEATARFPSAKIAIAIGAPSVREKIAQKVRPTALNFSSLIHSTALYSHQWVLVGEGTIICAGSILTVDIQIGEHVHINLDCTVGHDVIIGDYSTLSPGVHVSGCVHIGKRVFIGTGANIINGTPDQPLVIADDVVIGAGACVTRSITQSGVTAVGIPAKIINR